MKNTIKVKFFGRTHSKDRGIGYYTEHLIASLRYQPDIQITEDCPDIIHYPFFDLFRRSLPLFRKLPTVVTIHDLIPLVMKDRFVAGLRGNINLVHQRIAIRNVDAIITDSENSKRDIVEILNADPQRVHVTPLAHDPIFNENVSSVKIKEVKQKYNLPDKFILNVSAGPNFNKNLPALSEATKDLNIALVIVGKEMTLNITPDNCHPELTDLLKLQQYKHLILPGFVPSEDIVAFYKAATIYCQPSFYEGFGIPVLEAMAAGALLTSSNRSSLPEIYQGGTLTFNPDNVTEMTETIKKAINLPRAERKRLIDLGKKHAKNFSWQKTARLTVGVYLEVIKKYLK